MMALQTHDLVALTVVLLLCLAIVVDRFRR